MSVNIDNKTIKTEIFIAKLNIDKIFNDLKQKVLFQSELSGWIDISKIKSSMSYVELMTAMRWMPQFDKDGNIIVLLHDGFNVAEEELLFRTIAPFVKDGSFVEYEREGYSSDLKVRFDFTDKKVNITTWKKQYDELLDEDKFIVIQE